jgi:hypothetical protein
MGRGSVQTDQGHHCHRRLHCDGEQCNTNLKTRVCIVWHEYACLMVRGYKTAETKKTAHLKCMRRRYVVMYAS